MKRNVFAFAALLVCAVASGSPRVDLIVDKDWKFIQEDVSGGEAATLDDSSWQKISVPHCWAIKSGQTGDAKAYDAAVANPCWYRLHLTPDAALAGKSLFLKFDAVYLIAEVFVNGKAVGRHVGGFTAFCYNVTSHLQPGQENVIAVKVTGSVPKGITPPEGGDFTKFPGIYRPVHLLALEKLAISPLDDGASGVYLKPLRIAEAEAEVEVKTRVRNAHSKLRNANIRCRILNREGEEVAANTTAAVVAATDKTIVTQNVIIRNPHLWNGVPDPYLYRVEVAITEDNQVTDEIEQPLGLRTLVFDAKKGFQLNGKPYLVRGVNRHQEFINKGWAIGKAEMETDVRLLLEMGCTAVRLAHYPHSKEFHSLCDKAGLLVWCESPMVNGISVQSEEFTANEMQQIDEMVKQNLNHPSIFVWSLGNEWTLKEEDPAKTAFIAKLNERIHKLDPTRPTTAATDTPRPGKVAAARVPDVLSWNYYPGWYGLDKKKHLTLEDELKVARTGWSERLDESLKLFPDKPTGISEYGAGASIRQHQLHLRAPQPGGNFHPEEWQNIIHEAHWAQFVERPYLVWEFIWVYADFASLRRHEGDTAGINDKGLVTHDRKVKKDAFFFYQAQWTTEPMVHITGRRYTPHPVGETELKVYSNCERVELLINGKSLGINVRAKLGVFLWPNVTLAAGQNKIEAVATRNGKTVRDIIVIACAADAPEKLGENLLKP